MRYLYLIHRWLGIAFCLLFAMWFATGMVMHFVAFPTLTADERFAGMTPIATAQVHVSPEQARKTASAASIAQVRLAMRGERPQYVFVQDSGLAAIYADSGEIAPPAVRDEALRLALQHAHLRGLNVPRADYAELATHDQWTVPNGLDPFRPLHRIRLHDDAGTELYVSAVTGEVVRDTTRFERGWNYAGAVVHWIYPTALRKHWAAWDSTVWWLSLTALAGAVTGLIVGVARARWNHAAGLSPYRGMHYWHHMLGLVCAVFVLTYIFSGWLSMDHGRLFSKNAADPQEIAGLAGGTFETARFGAVPLGQLQGAKEIEFALLGGQPYLRARFDAEKQLIVDRQRNAVAHFAPAAVTAAARPLLSGQCGTAETVAADDAYYVAPSGHNAPLYRLRCADARHTWIHVDSASGQVIEQVDDSRRWYRWLYSALHTFDMPWLVAHPPLRTLLIVSLCLGGLLFSLTGVVIGWRRLKPRQ
ncbi:MAG TPA: PepSY domain-containing protein [Methylophilaceae bacterium]|nr:PepSY domain-containing protein [Methylophilaceae bacterium]